MTSAIPSPNATTSTNPKAGRPAAIDPSRISSALVDGMRPPARPRTNRLRQEIVVAGRWQVAVSDAAVAVLAGDAPWREGVVVVVRVLVVVVVGVIVAVLVGVRRRAQAPPTPALAEQHPATDRHDRDGGDDRRRADDRVRRQEPLRADHDRRQHEDPERVRDRHRQPESGGVERRPARPDEVGRHERLAVAGRQGVPGPERARGQDRDQQHDRRQVGRAEDRRQLAAGHAARDRGDGRCRDDDRWRAADRPAGCGRRASRPRRRPIPSAASHRRCRGRGASGRRA